MFARVFNIPSLSRIKIFVTFLMAFQAGAINSAGYIICHRFVSHVTGFATLVGIDIANVSVVSALSMASVPLFFLVGVMISAYFVDMRTAIHKTPQHTFLISTIAGLMYLVAIGGYLGWFGPFESPFNSLPNYPLIVILCLACGIQNGSITSASGSIIRTTHLTGNTTDLGLSLVRIIAHRHIAEIKQKEILTTFIRVGIIGSFILGSTIGAIIFLRIKFIGFLLPAFISSGLILWDIADRLHHKFGVRHG
jgi:uncharacterized membrane protein YoaK (UPF0700 family)